MEISVTMRAKDLRVGNIVHSKAETVLMISGWVLYEMTTIENINEETFLKPIPLTKEWLLKLGFTNYVWCENSAFIKLECGKSLYLRFYSDKWSCRKADIGKDEKGFYIKNTTKNTVLEAGKLKHVHQLQNLFFALTSEELTIKD